ncbi:uncharacterized protein LOC110422409 [Herrania umbratica]|uniref:Uncharacterized protein LOC110422409 n=1 Tax=Herrania umbratica TaxID=108875 RepID=A0A6J1AYB3_9ROSI|nr:uncharacterized protein LOC110422409 [Herrania umbratica]
MLGTGLQFGKVRGEDRFYIPVKARKNQNQAQKQKQKQEVVKEDNEKSSSNWSSSPAKNRALASDNNNNKKNPKETLVSSTVPCSEETGVSRSNLERFLESTRPSVTAQYFSKKTMRGRRTCDVEFQPYFTLSDLWESFKEWSAYGAGVPLVLDGSDGVVQYYVPYLSGIQLYSESMQANAKLRLSGEESDGDYYRDSSSDGSSDYEIDKGIKFPREQRSRFNLTNDIHFGVSSFSISDENSTLHEGFFSDDSEAGNSRDRLLFEFFEHDTPYSREPLADKIFDLACEYSGLKTLRSCDLLPISWISVAWYPIYRIPTGPTLKDLDACFLTYHSLCTPIEGSGSGQTPFVVYPDKADGIPQISLPVFGMASYKFKGSMWTQNGVSECQHANSLMQAAENWLRLHQVNHPDFQFFASHGMYL